MTHPYPRTERDLSTLAAEFTAGRVPAEALLDRLDELTWSVRVVLEAEKACGGKSHKYGETLAAACAAKEARVSTYGLGGSHG